MALASLDDVRKWIAEDKLSVDDVNSTGFEIQATRIIKSSLSGVFQASTLSSWNTPENTPAIIRGIAGELIAAYMYRQAYSEDDVNVPEYAQTLYNEAILQLREIRDGTLIVLGPDDEPVDINTLAASPDDFYPNDKAPGPYFKMEMEWA
jgi:hypothetical protein